MTPLWRWMLFAMVSLGAFLALASWIPAASERVYMLAPPLVLIAALFQGAAGRRWLGAQMPSLVGVAVAAVLLMLAYGRYAPGIAGPSWANLRRVLSSHEVFYAAYFLFSLVLVIVVMRLALLRACRLAFARSDPGPRRAIVVDFIALALLLAVATPYAISAIFMHRFKVANGQSPADWSRPFQDVEFLSSDGVRLHGWFVPAVKASSRTVILCHGIGANSAAFLGYLNTLQKLDANVFYFDFRGSGASGGHTVSLGDREKLDVIAAAKVVRERWPEQSRELMGLGVSMGASALVLAAAELEPPFDAIITDSGFASAIDLTENVLRQFPDCVRPVLGAIGLPFACLEAGCDLRGVRPEAFIDKARARVLIVHATGDFLIPLEHAQRLYSKALDPKMLWILEANQHGGVLMQAPQRCFDFVLGKESSAEEEKP
jgi:pimeloyl-ACP methyl ester carboxylesterase